MEANSDNESCNPYLFSPILHCCFKIEIIIIPILDGENAFFNKVRYVSIDCVWEFEFVKILIVSAFDLTHPLQQSRDSLLPKNFKKWKVAGNN